MPSPRTRMPILSLLIILTFVGATEARPTAMELFPKETLAFGRVAHFRELFERLQDSSTGRLLQDPNLQPLIEHLYGSARDAYADFAEEEVGLSLQEIEQIPQGEFAIGLIARQSGPPTFALLLDMGEDPESARKLLGRIQEEIVNSGADEQTRSAAGTQFTILGSGQENETLVFFERENTLVVCGDSRLAENMVAFWDGHVPTPPVADPDEEGADKAEGQPFWMTPLSQNEQFISIMRTCRNPGDPPPHVLFYVDPIEIFRTLNRDNIGARVALAMLSSLGLDGFEAVGGSMTIATEQYDDITHVHFLLDNPRTGVLTMLNLQNAELTPERFAPSDWVDTYITLNWNIPLTYDKLILLYDKFQYDGAFESSVDKNINDEVGIDFRQDVIEQLEGRISGVFGFPRQVSFNRRSILAAVHVKDEDAARATLKMVLDRTGETIDEVSYGGVDYYVITPPPFRNMPEEERPFEACMAFMEGCFVFANDRQMMNRAVAARDGTEERLADSLDYKLVASRIRRTSEEPGMLLFNRPEVGLRYVYELINSERAQDFIAEQRESNRFFGAIDAALSEHPLPAFETIARYFAPSGGFLYDTSNGLHYYQFSLRRE